MIDSIIEALKQFTNWLLNQLMDFFIFLLEQIPAPEFVDSAISAIESFGNYAGYPLYIIGFDVGFPMVAAAVLAKFLIRRIPFIG